MVVEMMEIIQLQNIGEALQTRTNNSRSKSRTTSEAAADAEANRLLKIKKRGRSQSIMTSSQGVTKTSADYSLGKKSLLGRV
jgi:hypothetical protein